MVCLLRAVLYEHDIVAIVVMQYISIFKILYIFSFFFFSKICYYRAQQTYLTKRCCLPPIFQATLGTAGGLPVEGAPMAYQVGPNKDY